MENFLFCFPPTTVLVHGYWFKDDIARKKKEKNARETSINKLYLSQQEDEEKGRAIVYAWPVICCFQGDTFRNIFNPCVVA